MSAPSARPYSRASQGREAAIAGSRRWIAASWIDLPCHAPAEMAPRALPQHNCGEQTLEFWGWFLLYGPRSTDSFARDHAVGRNPNLCLADDITRSLCL